MKFFRSVLLCFTIWVLTALLNTLLCGSYLFFFSAEFRYQAETYPLTLVFTLFFSVPAIFMLWIVMLVNCYHERLFRILLQTTIIVSVLSSLLLFKLPFGGVDGQLFFLSAFVVTAPVASLMIHHQRIISFTAK